MTFYLIGIDYKTVTPLVRGSAYRLRRDIIRYWQHANPKKTAILITCNRIEIYGYAENINQARKQTDNFRDNFNQQFKDAYIFYKEDDLFRHGLRLACGLESQLQGEFQIIEQLEDWLTQEDFPFLLKEIWIKIIKAAKEIRAKTGLDNNAINIAKLLFEDLKKEGALINNEQIIVIGTGKVAELIAIQRVNSANLIFIARRNHAKAQLLANLTKGQALLPDKLAEYLFVASAVVCATSSPHYVLKQDDFRKIINQRKKPLYIYDLAVPSDVAPEVSLMPFVRVKNLDSLIQEHSQRNNAILARIKSASELIDQLVAESRRLVHHV